jgi:hypothetical protein
MNQSQLQQGAWSRVCYSIRMCEENSEEGEFAMPEMCMRLMGKLHAICGGVERAADNNKC